MIKQIKFNDDIPVPHGSAQTAVVAMTRAYAPHRFPKAKVTVNKDGTVVIQDGPQTITVPASNVAYIEEWTEEKK